MKSISGVSTNVTAKNSENMLYENSPNPFSKETAIKYYIALDINKIMINIYDLQGSQVKNYNLINDGDSELIIGGSELKSGIYLCALIVDGKEVDTKRMILTD
jgi:hypothetical protein